jgi:hypothetical protein
VHLGRIYRKLGLRSRAELAPLFAEPSADEELQTTTGLFPTEAGLSST